MSEDVERLYVKEYADRFKVTADAVRVAIRLGVFPYPIDRPTGPRGRIQILLPKAKKTA